MSGSPSACRSSRNRALHVAFASAAPDDRAATVLAEAARAARARGAPVAAAAFWEHALRLSRRPRPERVEWETELADTYFEAGDAAGAAERLRRLEPTLPAGRERAEVLLRLAMVMRASCAPPVDWLAVAERALPEAGEDSALAAAIHAELSWAALFVNDLGRALEHGRTAAHLALSLDDAQVAARALDCLLYMELTAGIPADQELIARALELERAAQHLLVEQSPSLGYGFQLCAAGDLAAARTHLLRIERTARERGDESGLAVVCGTLTTLETLAGEWERAETYARETVELAEHTGVNWNESLHARAVLDAHLGRVDAALTAAGELVADAEAGGSLVYLVRALSLLGFIELSRRDLAAARAALGRATDAAAALGIGEPGLLRCIPDHVEALVAHGDHDEAERLNAQFERQAVQLGRAWAQATSHRCRGLILAGRGELPEALAALEAACAGHRGCAMPFELGRTLLSLGAVQRRANARRAARESLSEAREIFERLGAPLWAESARAELGRIGGRTPAGATLTPAEAKIAELVARGRTNREVAAELVVAVHTVESALTRIYAKLGVRSRSELTRQLAQRPGPPPGDV
jgi:DNA-binding CsgD family transcriptional regulator